MIESILKIIKYSVLLFCCFYGYLKFAKIKFRVINLLDIFAAVALSSGLYFSTKQIRILIPIGILLLACLYIFIRYRNTLLNTVVMGVISCGIAIAISIITPIISIPLELLLFRLILNDIIKKHVVITVICLLQLIFTLLIYRIKRFKSGINIKNNDESIEMLFLLSILSIFFFTLFYTDDILNSPFEIIIISLIFCGLGLLVWWKKHISNTYHTQIYKRNEAIYEKRIEEYEKERNNLFNQNAELSKIIHRDNKLIPAMVMAVKELISNSPNNAELSVLLKQLEDLSTEHRKVIENYQAKSDVLPKTSIIPIDAVLHFIFSKAKQYNIEFNVNIVNDSIAELLSKITDMTDLTTILCDLGENAIIATKNIPDGKILVAFEDSESKKPCICFYDNGRLFDEKVIANMGKRRITTHKDDGGSGIGLMTLFEILNKYNASYCLDERQNNEFTKCVRLIFDNLHTVDVIKPKPLVE